VRIWSVDRIGECFSMEVLLHGVETADVLMDVSEGASVIGQDGRVA
jgi:hypothetical protein